MTGVPRVAQLRPRLGGYLVPIAAVVAALLIGAMILLRLGADPVEGFSALFSGAFGSTDALIGTALLDSCCGRFKDACGRRSLE